MKGVYIDIHKFRSKPGNGVSNFFSIVLLILILVALSPILLLSICYFTIIGLFSRKESEEENNDWSIIETRFNLILKTKFLDVDETPDPVYKYLDPKPTRIFQSSPLVIELDGFFSDFMIERIDGIFLQKIVMDDSKEKVISAPLVFLDYESRQMEEIQDLFSCEIITKGKPNNFTICAFDNEKEFQIKLIKE